MHPTSANAETRSGGVVPASIRRASPDDAAAAVHILRSVAAWLVERGCPLWEPDSFGLAGFKEAALRRELVLGYEGSEAVACMLLQRSDPVFWPGASLGEALYLHKVAVLRHATGRGWSTRLIEWARAEALEIGARFLRLDTAPRSKLLTLYEKHGFRIIDGRPRYFGDVKAMRLEMEVCR
jgi:GNAT superfamily N-acetyltransferase